MGRNHCAKRRYGEQPHMAQILSTEVAAPATSSKPLSINAGLAVVLALVGGTIAHVWWHYSLHGIVNVAQVGLAFFLMLNVLVNFWEMGLYFTAKEIRAEYIASREQYRDSPMSGAAAVFTQSIPLSRLFTFKAWTKVWSSYALFDPGYARKSSFGFTIDVGNGFSTILPAALFALGMSYEIMPARALGVLGIAMFWQMLYGTILYFFQFFANGRHVGHRVWDIVVFVGCTNGLWFIFPSYGLYLSWVMIATNNFALLR